MTGMERFSDCFGFVEAAIKQIKDEGAFLQGGGAVEGIQYITKLRCRGRTYHKGLQTASDQRIITNKKVHTSEK